MEKKNAEKPIGIIIKMVESDTNPNHFKPAHIQKSTKNPTHILFMPVFNPPKEEGTWR